MWNESDFSVSVSNKRDTSFFNFRAKISLGALKIGPG